jgi:hypothetical protein
MSEDEAYVRIRVARAARRFPRVAEALARGEVHLSGLCRLAPHLTPENHRDLLAAARGRSKREIEQLLAARYPRPEQPDALRKLPTRGKRHVADTDSPPAATQRPAAQRTGRSTRTSRPPPRCRGSR